METRAPKERGIIRRLVAALIVAVAAGAIWSIAIGWGVAMVASWSEESSVFAESIVVTRDGTPLIRFYSLDDYQSPSYRTLEGQPAKLEGDGELTSATLVPLRKPPTLFDWPVGWGETLAASDFNRPAGGWYLVRDNRPSGHAYFVGYDALTNQLIGYIGRHGFSRSLPPVDEWFAVGRQGIGLAATGIQALSLNSTANLYDSYLADSKVPRWLVFMIDGDRLMEVDLRQRSVREILAAEGLASVAILSELEKPEETEQDRTDTSKMRIRVAARAKDRIFILNDSASARREFLLPASLAQESFDVFAINPDQILVRFMKRTALEPPVEQLVWIGSDGKVSREATVRLAQYANFSTSADERTDAIWATGFVPIPIFWANMLFFAPLGEFVENRQPTYAAAFVETLSMCWPALLLALGIGCVSASIIWRWQRKYFRANTQAWCAFAFLLGLPGVFAYWLEMRRATLETCTECKTVVPRDRDACASCAAPFPAPPLLGTELFA